ncbi:ABC transporter permease [Micromonospora olivasterospora]|uniref:Peptide/nickel transport system permease protein n=1 Tax=Micromonospora olivasterospora TaxID=1880 RepID=A0A562IJA2_MICOL|nr:ABC transporter permease [Micromonospora olivasterospora]TWH71087.1 peptide/nickel transport system permease protein [Micromonospora olivasterospora]
MKTAIGASPPGQVARAHTPRRVRSHGLLRFVFRRAVAAVLTLWGLSIAIFALVQLLPGDLGRSILGPYASDAEVARLNQDLGVDRPFWARYADWLSGFVTGDWGLSLRLGAPARDVILDRLANSLILAFAALLVVVPLAVAAGAWAALRQGRLVDRAVSICGVALMAIPEFVSGVFLLVIFGVYLDWFPVQSTVPTLSPVDIIRQLTLPVIPLCFILFGYIARMMRASTIDVLDRPYTRTARLKGLNMREVFVRHVFRNAVLPTITVIAGQAGYLIGGLVIVETLFTYPGIGNFAYESARFNDVEPLTTSVVIIGAAVLVLNLLGDIVAALLNPRAIVGGTR